MLCIGKDKKTKVDDYYLANLINTVQSQSKELETLIKLLRGTAHVEQDPHLKAFLLAVDNDKQIINMSNVGNYTGITLFLEIKNFVEREIQKHKKNL